MQIQVEQTENNGAFYILQNNERVAEMTFVKPDRSTLTIEHTEVSEVLRGTGAGKKLVEYAVEYARKNELKIIPVCPFVLKTFERNAEYTDVWKK